MNASGESATPGIYAFLVPKDDNKGTTSSYMSRRRIRPTYLIFIMDLVSRNGSMPMVSMPLFCVQFAEANGSERTGGTSH